MLTLLIATRNGHKVGEIRGILGGHYRYLSLDDFPGAPAVVEDAGSFAGNATKKAVELAKWVAVAGKKREWEESKTKGLNWDWTEVVRGELMVLADDSGLEVDALGGRPGVNSARFAAMDAGHPGNSPDAENNAKLLRLLKDLPGPKRTGRFRCVLALTPMAASAMARASPGCYADEFEMRTEIFEGICEGRIDFEPRGTRGFGYDPLFIPRGYQQSFAELGEDEKNRLSHRAKALKKLRAWLEAHRGE